MRAGSPARKCRSEPLRSTSWFKKLSMAGTATQVPTVSGFGRMPMSVTKR
jgi:hypothetical protein